MTAGWGMRMVFCRRCGDEFAPIELHSDFCSWECEGQAESDQEAYESARYGAAPMF